MTQKHTGGGNRRGTKASFGSTRKLPSGRHQARYTGPDGREHRAPTTFATKGEAQGWLSLQQAAITRDAWLPEASKRTSTTLAHFSLTWLSGRDLKPRTRAHYRSLLDRQILPTLGDIKVSALSPEAVEAWHRSLDKSTPTLRAHAYGLLKAIMTTAVEKRATAVNPCTIKGAGTARRRRRIEPATLDELEVVVDNMPDRYAAMVLLATWCALRFGELAELRRSDVDLARGIVRVRRGVTRAAGEVVVGTPKSAAGVRDVAIPPHLTPSIDGHLRQHVARGPDALLFPAEDGISHLATSTLYRHYYKAREAAGRPDLNFHALRHTGATLAAQTGATLAELMGRLGHSTPQAALIYQHNARGRDAEIAAALSNLAERRKS